MIKKKLIWTGVTVLLMTVTLLYFYQKKATNNEHDTCIALQCFKSSNGWAYAVYINHKKFIEQSFVPAIKDHVEFPTRRCAEKTGRLVIRKLMEGKSPALSKHDLAENGILDDLGIPR